MVSIKEQNALIRQIAQRAEQMYAQNGIDVQWEYVASELRIVYHEICELRLQELFEADEANFLHDICGIHEHLDILNGSFKDGFSPRYAK